MQRFLAPYWPSLAPAVVQDLQRRPQIAQYFSDLLSMTVAQLLRSTQIYTLPYFVFTKQRDILQRIADACNSSIKEVCMDHTNMSHILALIILRSPNEAEITIMTALHVVSSEFTNVNCTELVKSEPVLIAAELLKAAGDADGASKVRVRPPLYSILGHLLNLSSKAHDALYFLAGLMYGRHSTPRGSDRRSTVTSDFFKNQVLGIMAHLSDAINENKGEQTILEKVRCLRAIQEMMRIAKSNVNSALPQVCGPPTAGVSLEAADFNDRSLLVYARPSITRASATKPSSAGWQ